MRGRSHAEARCEAEAEAGAEATGRPAWQGESLDRPGRRQLLAALCTGRLRERAVPAGASRPPTTPLGAATRSTSPTAPTAARGSDAGSKRVVFRAAGPGRPSFGQIVSAASNIVVRGILIQDRDNLNGPCSDPDNAVLYPCGANQTFENVIVDGLNAGDDHGIRGVGDGFTLRSSVVRNIRDQKGFEAGADDMLIENNLWHRITVTNGQVHNECMYVNGGNRSVYRGNRFIGCPTMALFFTNSAGGAPYRDVVVENNVFGHTLGDDGEWHPSCAFKIGSGGGEPEQARRLARPLQHLRDRRVRRRAPGRRQHVDRQPRRDRLRPGVHLPPQRRRDVRRPRRREDRACGQQPVAPNQAPFYVDAPRGNFRLRAGAAAIDRGDRGTFPRLDGDRKRRPVGGAPDAGAYERS